MQQWVRERASMLRYTYVCLSCLIPLWWGDSGVLRTAYVGRINEKPEGTRSVYGRKMDLTLGAHWQL